jgi:hypothetical protein
MALPISESNKHEMYQGAVLDVDRHGGNEAPTALVPKPQVGCAFELDNTVARGKKSNRFIPLHLTACLMPSALPHLGSKLLSTNNYGMSLWGQTGNITAELPDGTTKHYFLKV